LLIVNLFVFNKLFSTPFAKEKIVVKANAAMQKNVFIVKLILVFITI
jgi:hypothetical protein